MSETAAWRYVRRRRLRFAPDISSGLLNDAPTVRPFARHITHRHYKTGDSTCRDPRVVG